MPNKTAMTTTSTKMSTELPEEYQTAMRKLFEQADHADVTLNCIDGTIFQAHKAILSAHSEFFKKALQADKFLEGETGEIDLTVGDSDTISDLLSYLYTAEYGNPAEKGEAASLWLDAKIYILADFYAINSLQKVSQNKFETHAAELCKLHESTKHLSDLPAIIAYIYENTVDGGVSGLRESIFKVIVPPLTQPATATKETLSLFQDTITQTAEFGRDYALVMLKKWNGFRKVQCQGCAHIWADPRPIIPHIPCPRCLEKKFSWHKYEVE